MFSSAASSSSQAGVDSGIIKAKGGVNQVVAAIHNELAVVRDNGIKGAYRVDFKLVNSKAYHDKFEELTGHKAVDEALYRRAALMLEHRSGTPYEDIAMLDSRAGKVLVENTSANGDMEFMSGLTSNQAEILNALNRSFEILHNHPNSSVPSSADIRWLFKRRQAVATTIIGHDGSVYRIKKLKAYDDFDDFMDALYDSIKNTHPEWTKNKIESYLFEQLIEIGERQGLLHYVKR